MAFQFPEQFRFADSHEYASLEEGLVRIGISAFAVDQLGDIVFVDLPEVGTALSRGKGFGSVESVKAVEEMYSPMSGEVVQNDPHGEGWLLVLKPSQVDEFQELMDAQAYASKVSS